jgi:hypothetical protein
MNRNGARDQRRGKSGTVAGRRWPRRRIRPTVMALEERTLLSTYTVNSTGDTGTGSGLVGDLRYCITQANAAGGNETIAFDSSVFSTPQTITLTLGQLALKDTSGTETITGPAVGVTVSGDGLSRVFEVYPKSTASISGLTITGGNAGTTNNKDSGGGLFNYDGTLTLTNCTISANSAHGTGGGLATGTSSQPRGTTTLTNCTVSGNSSGVVGGGLYTGNYGTSTMTDCTLSGNSSSRRGGGVVNYGGTITLTNCTISANSAGFGGGGLATSSIFRPPATTTVTNCTVSGNSAARGGGGLANYGSAGGGSSVAITLTNTIVAGNRGGESQPDAHGTFISLGNNLIGNNSGSSGFSAANHDQVGTAGSPIDSLLAPLSNYGGPTQTMALLPGSPALDAGNDNNIPSGVTTDQRGLPRIVNGTVDIGAFESSGFTIAVTSGSGQTAGAVFPAPLVATVTANNPLEPMAGGLVTFTPPASGASAILSGSPAVISASGTASVTAANNGFGGSYIVSATASGAPVAASFGLTNLALVSIAVSPGNPELAVGVTGQFTAKGTFADGSTGDITDLVTWASATPSAATISDTGVAAALAPGTTAITASLAGVTNPTDTLTVLAPSFVVDTTADSYGFYIGTTSLREAIASANVVPGQTITFDSSVFGTPQTITLGGTQLELSDTTGTETIAGPAGGVTINGNNASRVFQIDPNVTASISGLTIIGGNASNAQYDYAGGLFNEDGTLTLTDCTIYGNTAGGGAGLATGSFFHGGGTTTLTNCTVSGNDGCGVTTYNGTTTLLNTIVAGNVPIGNSWDIAGSVSGSNNLIGTGGSGGLSTGVDGNIVGVTNPGLAPLGYYGGTSETIALLPGSPAIGAGTSTGAPATDQRGFAPVGGVDIGAFQSQGFTLTPVAGSTPQSSNIETPFAYPLAVTVVANNPLEPVDGGVVSFVANPVGAATALLSSTSVVIGGGQAAISAEPDNALGSYTVVASAGGSFTTSFALTNTGTPLAALVVNTTSGSLIAGAGLLSLSEAVAFADLDSQGIPSITFDPSVFATPQTITLTGTQLELSNTTGTWTITGPAAALTISGGGLSRVFLVDSGVTASLSGLTISGGSTSGNGGGLYNDGSTTTLTNCTVSGNSAQNNGGGLFDYGTTTLTNCTVSGNSANNRGGGLYDQGGTTTLTNCTFSGNSASGGGGLWDIGGTMTLTDCTFSANYGGPCLYNSNASTTTLTDCTISGNSGDGLINTGTATLINCTVSGNTGTGVISGNRPNFYGTTLLYNCTISDDTGGGLYNNFVTITATNCIISSANAPPFETALSPASANNLIGGNPLLAPLGNYGGPTQTMALLPGSPAIGAGVISDYPGTTTPITTDQRGVALDSPAPDIGAFQTEGFTLTPVAGSAPQSANIGTQFAYPLVVTVVANNPIEPVDGGMIDFGVNPGKGPWAIPLPSSSAVIVNGQAEVSAEPNNALGSYNFVASAGGSSTTSFALTNTGTPLSALVVNTTIDSYDPGPGLLSLREAIYFANANLAGSLGITFDPTVFATPQTITLNLGQLELSNTSVAEMITAPAVGVTVSGGGVSRVFQVDSGVTASLSGLTISGGSTSGNGGGLYNVGTTSLTDCTVNGNTANVGGGLENSGQNATMMLTNCTISGNSARAGGGVDNTYGTAVLTNGTISGNSAYSSGGALFAFKATTTLTNCTVSGNSSHGEGGGMAKDYGTLTATDCTLSGNTASTKGGGLYVLDLQFGIDYVDVATLSGCTISGNSASNGGGVYAYRAGSESLTNCTIVGNSASGIGGGVDDNSRMTLTNCTISGNTAGKGGGGVFDARGAFVTGCIITGNSAGFGGGLYIGGYNAPVGDTVVAGNTAGFAPDVDRVVVSLGDNLIGATDGSSGWLSTDLTGTISHPVVYWTGLGGNSDWDTASNWLGDAVPGQNPQVVPKVVIPNGVTVQHTANTTETIDSLSLGTGATLDIGAGNFTFNGASEAGTVTNIVTLIMSGTGSVAVNGGSLNGSGLIRGNVTSSGLVDPTGSIVISGSYTQTATGSLAFALAGTEGGTDYGELFVNGAAMLDGALDVTLAGGFTPSAGDAFVPLSFGSVAGDFSTKTLPAGLVAVYNANTLILLPPAATTTTSGGSSSSGTPQTTAVIPQANVTVPSNAALLNLTSLPVGVTVTIDGNASNSAVTGPTQNFTAVIPQNSTYANLVVTGGSASNTDMVNGYVGNLTLDPAGTANTFIALNTQPVSVPTTSGKTVTSSTFVVNLNELNVLQAPETLPAGDDIGTLLDPSLLVDGAIATLDLGGAFQNAVAGNGVTLYAAPAAVSGAQVVKGSNVVLVGTGNTVYGAAGSDVLAYSAGNTVIQSSDSATTSIINAYAATTGPQAQSYLNSLPVAQQAFLEQNAAGVAQFLASNAPSLSAFLGNNPAAISQYLALNSTAQQAYLSGDAAGVSQYLSTNTAAESAFLLDNATAVTQYIAGVATAQQAFLQQNAPGVAAYIAGNPAALSAYLTADAGGIGAYIASNSTALAAFLQANPSAPNGSSALQAYLQQNPASLSAFLSGDPTILQAYLTGSATGLQSYLTGNLDALSAYVQADAAAISQYVASNAAAQQAFLQQGGAGLAAYVVGTPAAEQAFLAADPAGVSAYLVSTASQATLSAFLATDPAAQSAYGNGGGAGLQAYLIGNSSALQAFLGADPGALGAYLSSSPSGLQSYLLGNPSALQSYVQQDAAGISAYIVGNPVSQQAYLAADTAGVSAYIVSNPTALGAFLNANPGGEQAYIQGGNAGLQAFLEVKPTALQQFIASNPTVLQQYLAGDPTGLLQYLSSNPAVATAYLSASPTSQQAYIAANAAGISAYLVANPTVLNAYLGTDPAAQTAYGSGGAAGEAALQAYLAASPAALQQYIAGNPAVIQQYLAGSPTGLSQYLGGASTALQQYLSDNPSALQTYLAGNVTALQTYLSSNPSALQQYLAASPSVLQQYIAANPTALQTYLSSNSTVLQTYLSSNPTVLQQYLIGSPAVLQQYLSSSTAALQGYLQQNNAAVVQYLSSNASAQSAYLQQNAPAVAAYIAGNATALSAYLAADSAGIGAYIASNSTALAAYLQANPSAPNGGAALQAYLQQNPATLSSFLVANPTALQSYLTSSPATLESYFSSDPAGLTAYLQQVPTVVAQFIAGNANAEQTFLEANASGVAAYLSSSGAVQQAFLQQDASGLAAYIPGNSTALSAYLNVDAGGIGAFIASNSTALAAYLQANPSAPNGGAELQAYLQQNPTSLSTFLTGDPSVLEAYLAASPASLAQYLQGSSPALQSYLAQNAPAVAAYIASNPVTQQAYLSADAAGFSAYLTGNSTLLGTYLASSAYTGDPKAVAAYGSGTLQAYLATDPPSLLAFVATDPTALQQYIGTNPPGLQGYLTGNTAVLATYLASSSAAQQAYLAANIAGIGAYLTSNDSALSAFLTWDTTGGNSDANAAYLSGGSVGLEVYLAANPGDLQAYIAAQGTSSNLLQSYLSMSPTGLEQYLSSASTTLEQYVSDNPAALSSYLAGDPTILLQYIEANPATFQQYLTSNNAVLQSYLSANPGALQQFLASSSTVLQEFLAQDPGSLQQYLASNATALQTYLQQDPAALLQYLESAPTALSQYLTANTGALVQFLQNNPAALEQFLATDPALLQQFLQNNPAVLEQFLTAEGTSGAAQVLTGSLLSLFRLNVTLPGSGNEATGGPLSTFNIGSGSLFIESINASQLAMVTQGLASGLAVSDYQLNVTAEGSNNTMVGGVLANFTVTGTGGDNNFIIEDASLLGLPVGTAIPSLTGTFNGNGPSDTFYVVGGASGNSFGNIVLTEPIGATGDTLNLSNFQDGGIDLDLDYTSAQVVSASADLNLTLPANGAVTNVIGTPTGDNITGGSSSTRIQDGEPDTPNPNAVAAVPPASVNTQWVVLNFTQYTPTVVSSSETFHNGNGYYLATEQAAVLAGMENIYSQFSSLVQFSLDPAEINQLQGMTQAQLAQIDLSPADVTTLASLVNPNFVNSAAYQDGNYETVYFNDTPVFNSGLGSNGQSASVTPTISGGAVTGFGPVSGGSGYVTAPAVTLVSGTGAAATATVSGGAVTGIAITSVGAGYTSAPTVSITGGGGSGATATAVVTVGQVTAINITGAGTGYTLAPTITLISGSGATATASLGVSSAVITYGGSGYASAPTVTFSGGGGSGATATAVVAGGKVSAIEITKPGSGYTSLPTITLTGGGATTVAAATAVCEVTGLIITSPGSGYTSPPTVIFGTPSAGGLSHKIDFGDTDQTTTMQFDVNGFLGTSGGLVPDSSADSDNGLSDFVNMSVTIASHELGHTLGLEHMDAMGPIGFGISNPPGANEYYPAYAGEVGAFTTDGDVIASPASVGSTLVNAADGEAQLGARDAITLAFITDGTTVASNTTDPSNPSWSGMPAPTVAAAPLATDPVQLDQDPDLIGVGASPASEQDADPGNNNVPGVPTTVMAQPVDLYTLNVPNPITTGLDAGMIFDVSAVDIDGYLGGSTPVLDSNGNPIINSATGTPYTVTAPNYYTFAGSAGLDMSFQVMSASLTLINDPVDTVLTVYGPNGQVVAFNDDQFEPSDSSIFDVTLPSTGTYTVEVSAFQTTDSSFLNPNSQNYDPGAYYDAQHGAYELFMYTFSAFNAVQPPSVTNGTTATVVLPASQSGTTDTIYLNDKSVATVPSDTSWYSVTNLSNGSNTITVSYDNGNSLSSYDVLVDTTPPTVAVASGPTAETTATTATFTFSGSDAVTPSSGLVYLASLDGAPFSAVTDPANFSDLSVGTHTLEVEAEDQAGNISQPVSTTWTVEPAVSTTTAVDSSALDNTSVYGQTVNLTATIGQDTVSPNGPTGEVDFYDGTTKIGSANLTSGQDQVSIPVMLSAGSHIITATYEGDGTDLTSTSTSFTLTLTPAPLTITANNESKTYGGAYPVFSVSYAGFAPGEGPSNLGGVLTFATNENNPLTAGVGSYSITPSGLTSSNYAIQFATGTLMVNAAPLTVTATGGSMTYGGTVPALTYTYTGLVNGDTSTSFRGGLATSAKSSSNVGGYSITQGTLTATGNYTIGTFNSGTLTVNAAPLTVTATGESMTYGGTVPALTYTYTGLVNGDTSANFSGGLATSAIPSSDIGGYSITQGTLAATGNYTISTFNSGTLTVNAASLTITADNQTKVYGQESPSFIASYQGFVLGQNAGVLSGSLEFTTSATAGSPVGAYAVALNGLTSTDYAVHFVSGVLRVTPAPLTVSAPNAVKLYGLPVPTMSAVYSGFVNGDTAASLTTPAKLATSATASSPVGIYPIAASGASSGNYTIQYVPGVLTVEPNAGPVAFVTTLYKLTVGRLPGPAALTSWLTQLSNGEPNVAVARQIYDSHEARLARARHKVPQLSPFTVYTRALKALIRQALRQDQPSSGD